MTRALALATTLGAIAAGCIGTSPEERERAEQGPYDDGDEEHRPGQPCLVCHRADYNPGGDQFVVAGTVYLNETDTDEEGIIGVEVVITDDDGTEIVALTNTVGNFMVEVDGSLSEPRRLENGRLRVPAAPVFPLRVSVRRGGVETEMESLIQRDGSCAGCHDLDGPSATREGRVYLNEAPP